jgi:sugar phosphate isomerase/epimerase
VTRLAYNTFSHSETDEIEALLDDVSLAGFTGVGLFSVHARLLAAADSGGLMKRALTPTGFYVEFLHPDDHALDRHLDEAMQACHTLDIRWLVVIPGPGWRHRPGWKQAVTTLLGDISQHVGVLLEPLTESMADVTCLHTVPGVLGLLEDLSPDRGGWVLDTAHLLTGETIELSTDAMERLVVVQLADLARAGDHPDTRLPPGSGCLPLAELVGGLRDGGHDGWWETEVGHILAEPSGRLHRLKSLRASVSGLVGM